ncbi:MAG: hypothetical protein HZC47_01015 [Methanobacterium sp.]|uniref:hypothetical protein n=1 Tax=Methanobacterium sp. TaxID=2164 RepID=UPI003D65B586|nr:hypothetical protein [Methanobacterium sp.]
MDIEEKWIKDNWNIEEIDLISDTYYISFWLKEDLKKFIDKCFEYDIPMTFSPPYALAIPKYKLKLLIKKIENNEKVKEQKFSQESPLSLLH